VALSTDGGSTFPIVLGSAPATKPVNFTVPNTPTTTARVRAVWINPPAGAPAEGINPGNFRIETPYVRITSPNGGEQWSAGTKQIVGYQTNLPGPYKLELSLDNGATYPVVLASQFSGAFKIVADASWESDVARVRITTLGSPTAQDASDQSSV
jgi:hypothetical protein